jgi:carbamoyl-phosphate synthase large subunit
MKLNNILILSAGRRVELVEAFKAELKIPFPDAKVFAIDISPQLSSACNVADDYFKAPYANSDEYIIFLKNFCIEMSIALVIPTIDTELKILSQNKENFENIGVKIVVSNQEVVQRSNNKFKTISVFNQIGLDSPAIYSKSNIKFPCFVKPFEGSSSKGIFILHNKSMLTKQMLDNPKIMFSEYISSEYDEYTVDLYYDKFGKLKSLVPRLRIETRAGEVSKGLTKKDYVYDFLIKKIPKLKGFRGPITLQLFANEKLNSFKAIEINPRFGGGYPLSYAAGANFPQMLIREYLRNENLDFDDSWESNLPMLRYDAKVLISDYRF